MRGSPPLVQGTAPGAESTPPMTAKERAYLYLRDAILTGRLPVGSVLGEAALAHELQMSRTPVREGLQRLVQDRLLDVGQRRQLVVRTISMGERREVFLMRAALEGAVVREACRSISEDTLDELRALLFRLQRAADAGTMERFIDLDERFHLKLAAGADLFLFQKVLTDLRALVRLMGLEALRQPKRMQRVIGEHEAILEALERRDEVEAAEAMQRHLSSTIAVLEEKHAMSVHRRSGIGAAGQCVAPLAEKD